MRQQSLQPVLAALFGSEGRPLVAKSGSSSKATAPQGLGRCGGSVGGFGRAVSLHD